MRRVFTIIAAGACALAIAGCPGDGELDREALLERGNRICADAAREERALPRPTIDRADPQGTYLRIAQYAAGASRILRRQTADLRELGRSEERQKQLDDALRRQRLRLDTLRSLHEAATSRRPVPTLRALERARSARARSVRAGRGFGFYNCA